MKRIILLFITLVMLAGCGALEAAQSSPGEDTSKLKTEVTIAVPIIEENADLESSISGDLYDIITGYNDRSGEYKIVPVGYSGETELQLMITSGDVDLINWGESILTQGDGPDAQMYASKGYLLDLESEKLGNVVQNAGFIENILALDKNAYGGVYTLPLSFYGRTLVGKSEYVGTESGWTLEEMLDVAERMPEDMVLYSNMTQSYFLELMLDCVINNFIDLNKKTADFSNENFYSLLRLCKNEFPGVRSENEGEEDALLYVTSLQAYAGMFGEMILENEEKEGICPIGYPLCESTDGNGMNLVFVNELSVAANTENAEGAADFLAYVFSAEIQEGNMMCSPIQSVFESVEESYVKQSESCTKEISEAAMEYVYHASSIAMRRSPISQIVLEEAEAYFSGDKTLEEVTALMESRAEIYLSEQY